MEAAWVCACPPHRGFPCCSGETAGWEEQPSSPCSAQWPTGVLTHSLGFAESKMRHCYWLSCLPDLGFVRHRAECGIKRCMGTMGQGSGGSGEVTGPLELFRGSWCRGWSSAKLPSVRRGLSPNLPEPWLPLLWRGDSNIVHKMAAGINRDRAPVLQPHAAAILWAPWPVLGALGARRAACALFCSGPWPGRAPAVCSVVQIWLCLNKKKLQ